MLQADPDAHTTFVRLTKAYEVLKDAESRKKYDLYGEEGVGTSDKQSYHSWSYYRDNFGIYDDDPEIVTLNKADFGKYWHDFPPCYCRHILHDSSQFIFTSGAGFLSLITK